MAKYNPKESKAAVVARRAQAVKLLRREPKVIPKSKWPVIKIGVLVSIILNVAAIVALLL